ncbi:hypothetical protein D9M72_468450 [compost metagenome]
MFPDYMQNDIFIIGIGFMAMNIPIGRLEMYFYVSGPFLSSNHNLSIKEIRPGFLKVLSGINNQ